MHASSRRGQPVPHPLPAHGLVYGPHWPARLPSCSWTLSALTLCLEPAPAHPSTTLAPSWLGPCRRKEGRAQRLAVCGPGPGPGLGACTGWHLTGISADAVGEPSFLELHVGNGASLPPCQLGTVRTAAFSDRQLLMPRQLGPCMSQGCVLLLALACAGHAPAPDSPLPCPRLLPASGSAPSPRASWTDSHAYRSSKPT